MEHFVTREGLIEVIKQKLGRYGTYDDAEAVLGAINKYKDQFAYKCQYTWCSLRKPNTMGSRSYPGFKSRQDLEDHRLTHPHHHLRNIRHSLMGTPWYECSCEHTDQLTDEELELYFEGKFKEEPRLRLEHLERVHNDRVQNSKEV